MKTVLSKLFKLYNVSQWQANGNLKVTTKLGVKLEKIDVDFRQLSERLEKMVKDEILLAAVAAEESKKELQAANEASMAEMEQRMKLRLSDMAGNIRIE